MHSDASNRLSTDSSAALRSPSAKWRRRLIPPLFIGLIFGYLGWLGSPGAGPVYPDAARHVLNGALLADLIRDSGWSDPIRYAAEYYKRLPALSLGYHPPGLPILEAFWFLLVGVDYSAARVLIALTTVLSSALLYLLVLRTHASPVIAAAVTVVSMMSSSFVFAASEVMLEMPSLMLALAALHAFVTWNSGSKTNATYSAIIFTLFTSAAIWTKQQWILLIPIPIVVSLLRGEWCAVLHWRTTLVVGFCSIATYGVIAFSRIVHTSNAGWRNWPLHEIAAHHIRFYSEALARETGLVGTVLLAISIAYYVGNRVKANKGAFASDVYVAWAISGSALLVFLRPWDSRYLFHIIPPLALLLFTAIPRRSIPVHAIATAGVVIAFASTRFPIFKPVDEYGYENAARTALAQSPRRMLYCGPNPGGFVYAVRKVQDRPQAILIRGEKLPADVFSTATTFRTFAYDYAVDTLVFESGTRSCAVNETTLAALEFVGSYRITSETRQDLRSIRVYRNHSVSATPQSTLTLRSELIPGGIETHF